MMKVTASFFSDRVINWWNKLDNDVVCATSANAFKNRLQRIWEKDKFVFGPINSGGQTSTGVASSGKHKQDVLPVISFA